MLKFSRFYNFIFDKKAKISLANGKEIIANADILTMADAVSDRGFHVVEYTAVDRTKHSIDSFISFKDVNTRASEALQFRRLIQQIQ